MTKNDWYRITDNERNYFIKVFPKSMISITNLKIELDTIHTVTKTVDSYGTIRFQCYGYNRPVKTIIFNYKTFEKKLRQLKGEIENEKCKN